VRKLPHLHKETSSMNAKARALAERREALLARCADQRAQVAQQFAILRSPEALGALPAYLNRHKKTALTAAGVAAVLFVLKPKWTVGIATGAVSLYKLAQRALPILKWKGFEVH
jgi:hypothetical protein